MYRFSSLLFAFFLLAAMVPQGTAAQNETASRSSRDQLQIHEHARPGRATLVVNVWGTVGQPGLWRVENEIDLIELLSVVGVPGLGLDEPGTRQKNMVSIYRTVDGQRQEVYTENLKHILRDGASYPQIQDGDVLAVTQERKRSIGFGVITTVIGTASSIAILVLQLTG